MNADAAVRVEPAEPPVADRQPFLPRDLLADAGRVGDGLADDVGRQAAAVTVHAAALEQHARRIGLGSSLADVARLHPALDGLADVDTSRPEVRGLWERRRAVPDDTAVLWWSYPLGDLYQALSVESRKNRALCQTPWWVADLLLRVSYDRAVEDWAAPRIIDPSCGTGHLLLESWTRIVGSGPGGAENLFAAADRVHGVDLDPYAVLVARYRMVALAWARLRHRHDLGVLRDLPLHVHAADSLLDEHPLLAPARYEVVLANPPYITPKDPAANAAIRARYPEVCSGKYSLALPFHSLMMRLLVDGGWCAQLTANSFMKREFGRKYVQDWLPRFDARWIIDCSGAYIPGHGTPTVILVHRNRPPVGDTVRVVQGVRGEPATPAVPARGLVWTAIRDAVHAAESADRFARRAPTHREMITRPGSRGHRMCSEDSVATPSGRQ